jgi:hypothetical protein
MLEINRRYERDKGKQERGRRMKIQDTVSFSTGAEMTISVLVYDCVKRIMKSKFLKTYLSFRFMVTSLEQHLNYFSNCFVIDELSPYIIYTHIRHLFVLCTFTVLRKNPHVFMWCKKKSVLPLLFQ